MSFLLKRDPERKCWKSSNFWCWNLWSSSGPNFTISKTIVPQFRNKGHMGGTHYFRLRQGGWADICNISAFYHKKAPIPAQPLSIV